MVTRAERTSGAAALLASAAAGALGAIVWSGPRSEYWPFAATVDDRIEWSSVQSTATTVGQLLVVVTVALAAGFRVPTRIAPWVVSAAAVIVLAFTKVAIPEAASLSVLIALHVVKSCAAGILVGLAVYAIRWWRPGWIALASGAFAGLLLASLGAESATGSLTVGGFLPTRLDSTSVFGEPAWWLVGAAFVLAVVAAVLHRPVHADADADVGGRDLVRLTVYAVIVAAVCRVGVEVVGTGVYEVWKAVAALAVAVIVVDRVAARWEAADARTVIAAVLLTVAAIAMWNVTASVAVDPMILLAVGIGGLVIGALIAWRAPIGRFTSLGAALLLTAVPLVAALVDIDAASAVATGVVAALIPITLTAVSPDGPHASVLPLAVSLPGLAILVTAAAPVPSVDLNELTAMVPPSTSSIDIEAGTGSLSFLGYDSLDGLATDLTSAYLLCGAAAVCLLRLAWLSRRVPA